MSKAIAVKTRVLFTRKEKEKKTESGIVLTHAIDDQNPLGYVYSIGPDVAIEGLEIGDAININWQAVGMMKHEDETLYIVDQNNINAIVK